MFINYKSIKISMKILIIEDEKELSDNIKSFMSSENYICEQAFTFYQAVEKIDLYTYDCILLDLNLPEEDGLKLLNKINERKINSGIIIISARDSLDDKIEGLKQGADDYLPKPFSLSELSIRIYALMRRKLSTTDNMLVSNNIAINLFTKKVTITGKEIVLTKSEFALLLFLISNKNRVVSKNSIAEHLSGDMADMLDNQDFVYAHIKNLKAKLAEGGAGNCIKTVYAVGYQWVEE